MKIDPLSKNIITIALYLNKKEPNSVSEIWIDPKVIDKIKQNLPSENNVLILISDTETLLKSIIDKRRKQYLSEILQSLKYQIKYLKKDINFSKFSKQCFGFEIKRVTQKELTEIDSFIKNIESKLNKNRFDILKGYTLDKTEVKLYFLDLVNKVKNQMPQHLLNFDDQGFGTEIVIDKAWSAFNSHISPFKSKIELNTDVELSKLDLKHLAHHEAYAGHHTELSLKDKLLVNEGRGEHGLVITFSPQTFISEAIAEGYYALVSGLDKTNDTSMLHWYYDRLQFGLQNLATFLYFEDHKSKKEIKTILEKYEISNKSRTNIINFSTDPQFGKYAPVYFSAYSFFENVYKNSNQKEKLIRELFTQPCTPNLLSK